MGNSDRSKAHLAVNSERLSDVFMTPVCASTNQFSTSWTKVLVASRQSAETPWAVSLRGEGKGEEDFDSSFSQSDQCQRLNA